MNTKLKTLALSSLLLPAIGQAELTLVDDDTLSSVTGREGLTIDIDMGVEVGEFMYKDAGAIVMQGIRMGGMDGSDEVGTKFDGSVGIVYDPDDPTGNSTGIPNAGGTTGLNNIKVHVDIAGDGSDLDSNGVYSVAFTGFPPTPTVTYMPDNYFRWAWGNLVNPAGQGITGCGEGFRTDGGGGVLSTGDCLFQANDGDLFIHATANDKTAFQTGYISNVLIDGTIVASANASPFTIGDFGFEMDRFALKDSNYVAGDDINDLGGSAGTSQETTIISNLKMEGFFGGYDLYVQNNGNGFGEYDALGNFTETGIGDAASKIKINSFFRITHMDYDFDIVGIRYKGISIGDTRGNTAMFDMFTQEDYPDDSITGQSQGFAQTSTHIYAVKDNVLRVGAAAGGSGTNRANFVDGITIDSRFNGDMDIWHLSFGDTNTSIGSLHYTDMDIDTVLTLSAH